MLENRRSRVVFRFRGRPYCPVLCIWIAFLHLLSELDEHQMELKRNLVID